MQNMYLGCPRGASKFRVFLPSSKSGSVPSTLCIWPIVQWSRRSFVITCHSPFSSSFFLLGLGEWLQAEELVVLANPTEYVKYVKYVKYDKYLNIMPAYLSKIALYKGHAQMSLQAAALDICPPERILAKDEPMCQQNCFVPHSAC